MAVMTPLPAPGTGNPGTNGRTASARTIPRFGGRVGPPSILILAGAYFLIPILCALAFTLGIGDSSQPPNFDAYVAMFTTPGLAQSLLITFALAAATVVLVFGLLLPALLTVRIAAPKAKPVVAAICIIPLVVPAIALVAGISTVLGWGTDWLYGTTGFGLIMALQDPSFPLILVFAFALLALPLAYTTLESGFNAVDVRVLVEAARSCRASWPRTLFLVVLPNLREALLNTAFLTIALVLGEYAVSSILGFQPFAVWIVTISGSHARLSVAVSMVALIGTWLLLLAIAKLTRPRAQKLSPLKRTS